MKLTELLERLNKIYNEVSDIRTDAEDLIRRVKKVETQLEDLPTELSEVEIDLSISSDDK